MSILFIFSKSQFLVLLSLLLFLFLFHLFLLSSYNIFPSTNFGFFLFIILFPIVVGVKLGCLFNVFLVYWGRIVFLCTSLLGLLLLHPIGFWVVMFSLSFVSRNFFISLLISSVTCWLFRNALFNLHVFVFLTVFSCNWYLVS